MDVLKKIRKKSLVIFMAVWMGISILMNSEESLFGDSVNIGKNADATGNRGIILAKNNTPDISSESSDSANTSPGKKEHENMQNVMSSLGAEKKRLRELEQKYLKLQGVTSETGLGKYFKSGTEKDISTVSVPDAVNLSETVDKTGSGVALDMISGNSPLQGSKNVQCQKNNEGAELQKSYDDIVDKDSEPKAGLSERLHQYLAVIEEEVNPVKIAECFFKLGEYEKTLESYKNIPQEEVSSDQYMWIQYQVANCYRYLKKYDEALGEFQNFIDKYTDNELVVQAKWYIDDINWWKEWREKNTLKNNKLLMLSDYTE
ncbi:MAG: tetratricopeptide repeat protein [Candidatus Kuenenia sp.]|nr:tetratricopeptide repeat protein [Candidatus Kuenenia hertensis]